MSWKPKSVKLTVCSAVLPWQVVFVCWEANSIQLFSSDFNNAVSTAKVKQRTCTILLDHLSISLKWLRKTMIHLGQNGRSLGRQQRRTLRIPRTANHLVATFKQKMLAGLRIKAVICVHASHFGDNFSKYLLTPKVVLPRGCE